MSKQVNVDFVTRQIEVDTDGKEHFISAAMAAKDAEASMLNAQNAANEAEKIATDLGLVDEAVQTAVASATTASNKADIATAKADIATTKASEASTSAATATAKAEVASTSATNAAQSYANADGIATQLTEYLATKETLTAPAVDKTLLIEGAAADSKVVGELKSELNQLNNDVYDISSIEFEQGAIDGGTGFYDSTKAIRSKNFIRLKTGTKIKFNKADFQLVMVIYKYSSASTSDYISGANVSITLEPHTVHTYISDTECFAKIRVIKGNGNDLLVSESFVSEFASVYNDKIEEINNKIEDIKSIIVHTDDMVIKCNEFTSLFNNSKENDSYLFFTDPHLLGSNGAIDNKILEEYIYTIKQYYDTLPFDFICCGGDWLNMGDTPLQAKYKLGYMNGIVYSNFENYYPIVGNHDTNYGGTEVSGEKELETQTISNLMCRKHGKSYYSFDTLNTKYYVLDSYTDYEPAMSDYKWAQLKWLCEQLIANDSKHSVIMFHIFFLNETTRNTFTDVIGNIITAYNNRSSYTTYDAASKTFDFSACSGRIEYCLCGHSHKDFVEQLGGVPAIGAVNLQAEGVPNFDMLFVDYDNDIVKCIRVGTGNNRTISLA